LGTDETNSYAIGATALLIAESAPGDATQALALTGIRVRAQVDFAHAAEHLSEQGLDMIVIEAAAAPEALVENVLARVDAVARERHLSIVAAVSFDQVDLAYANLFGPHAGLLCDPTMPERVNAFAVARASKDCRRRPALHDVGRDAEAARLQRLNEEVARIADTLARLSRSEGVTRRGNAVREPGSEYCGPVAVTAETSAAEIRAVIRSRRLRAQFFAPDLLADPAWDMLLDLFAAALEQRQVSVSSLCIAAAVPPTTALRWISTLHEAGLFARQADPSDRRRAYIGLSAKGLEGMRGYVSAAKRAGIGLV
jgi:hypothetical protein